jgi:hypothetical protein
MIATLGLSMGLMRSDCMIPRRTRYELDVDEERRGFLDERRRMPPAKLVSALDAQMRRVPRWVCCAVILYMYTYPAGLQASSRPFGVQ